MAEVSKFGRPSVASGDSSVGLAKSVCVCLHEQMRTYVYTHFPVVLRLPIMHTGKSQLLSI